MASTSASPWRGRAVPPSRPSPAFRSSISSGRTPAGSKPKRGSPNSIARARSAACRVSSSTVRKGGPGARHATGRSGRDSHTSPGHSSEASAGPFSLAERRSTSSGSSSAKPKPGTDGGATRRVKGWGRSSSGWWAGSSSRFSARSSPCPCSLLSARGATWEMSFRKSRPHARAASASSSASSRSGGRSSRAGRDRLATCSSMSAPERLSTSSRCASASEAWASLWLPACNAATAPTSAGTASTSDSSTAPGSRFTPSSSIATESRGGLAGSRFHRCPMRKRSIPSPFVDKPE